MKAEETAILRQWVSDGLFWPAEAPTQTSSASSNEYVITPEHRSFWSFQPVKRPAIPAVKGKAPTAIDAFVLERIEKEGLIAAPRADKRSLIRRAIMASVGRVTGLISPGTAMTFSYPQKTRHTRTHGATEIG
jgi:hypothetical protein